MRRPADVPQRTLPSGGRPVGTQNQPAGKPPPADASPTSKPPAGGADVSRTEPLPADAGDEELSLVPTVSFGTGKGTAEGSRRPQSDGHCPRHFGDYELLEEIARGGMGVVYRARQKSLNRIVAIKMILAGQLASPEDVRRFYAEAEAAANLDHPGIVPIYEVGEHEGQHYFSMGFVDGPSLSRRLADDPLLPQQAAELAFHVVRAVACAHEQGVVHRDLKPANILLSVARPSAGSGQSLRQVPAQNGPRELPSTVTSSPACGVWIDGEFLVPRITDFGLAKRTGSGEHLTMTGQVMGTPGYMPPEQAGGRGHQVGPLADVYSLGAVLYTMLCGRPPLQSANIMDTLLQVLERDPIPPRQLNASIPRDLETICLKCLEKNPTRRYGSAHALAAELQRFLNNEPIEARPIGMLARGSRWCRRKPAMALLLTVCVLALLGGTVISSIFAARARQEATAARQAQDIATEKLWESYVAQAQAGRWSGQPGRRFESLEALAKAAAIRPATELRSEAIACLSLADLRRGPGWDGCPKETSQVAVDPALKRYARSEATTGDISIRTVHDDRELFRIPWPGRKHDWLLQFSSNGRSLAIRYAGGLFHVRDIETRKLLFRSTEGDGDTNLDFHPDNRRIAVAGRNRTVGIYELGTGRELQRLESGTHWTSLKFSPDGLRLAAASRGSQTVAVFDLSSGQAEVLLEHGSGVRKTDWRSDGALLASACADSSVYVWDLSGDPPSEPRAVLSGHQGVVDQVAFSRGGDLLVSTGWDGLLCLWDPLIPRPLVTVRGVKVNGALQFGPHDRRLFGWKAGTKIGFWELAAGRECRRLHGDPRLRLWSVATAPNGRVLAMARTDGVAFWNMASGLPLGSLTIGSTRSCLFSPDGRSLVTWGVRGLERRTLTWQESEGDSLTVQVGFPEPLGLPASRAPEWAAMSADGRFVAAADRGRSRVSLFDLHERRVVWHRTFANPSRIAISPDGRWIACGTWNDRRDRVRVWSRARGTRLREFDATSGAFLAFSPDSRRLVVGNAEEDQFYVCESWEAGPRIPRNNSPSPRPLFFSPDGSLVAARISPRLTRLLEADTLREIATFPSGSPAGFTADGQRLIAEAPNQTIEIWDLHAIRLHLREMGLDWSASLPDEPFEPKRNLQLQLTSRRVD
ncbi:MAG: protein kinase [Planctomycetes bacterium]|nr:protein kinase [Planctomycetota bacterium]